MIDVHCHLIDPKYQDRDVRGIIDEAKKSGVQMIVNGTSVENSKKSVELAEKNVGVWAAVGVHPEENCDLRFMNYELKKLASHKKVVAIGEIGLDYREKMAEEDKVRQKELFKPQLDLAEETGLPAIVHNRNAYGDIFDSVSGRKVKVLLHCFSGTVEFMSRMADLGCYFSFGGMITYKKNDRLREVVRQVPADRLLVETDAPYLPPEPVRGTINTPANVKIVAERMAGIRGVSAEVIDRLTSENARRLFLKMK